MKRKITVTTGSRSEYGILRPVIHEISKSKKLELYLIVSGMHLSRKHGLTVNEIKHDGFKIHETVNMLPEGDSTFSMSKALGKGILEFSTIFNKLKPDINIILGDRDEAFASALAASHMNIPNGLYFIKSGRITVELRSSNNKIRLKSMSTGTVVGEVSLYLKTQATASVISNTACKTYFLSHKNFEKLNKETPERAAELHTYIVKLLSDRLAKSNATIQALM